MTLQGPNGGNLHSSSGVPNPGQQDPRLQSGGQDPGPSPHPQHPAPARPVFYVHAPPPLPFLHYQWPMPFSYNPFAGFPGVGYGMVMPPFPPPPPYMEAPSYVLPHPHVQAVDYRRLLHPQPNAPYAPCAPYQNQTRRVRPPHSVPVRQTVNSEVQTEPPHRGTGGYGGGSLIVGSDSGHGTASSSPSSSSSSQKGGSVENYILPGDAEDVQVKKSSTGSTIARRFNVPDPAAAKTVLSRIRATQETQKSHKDGVDQENAPPCRNRHCDVWSASSPDSMVPVCSSSQQEDEAVKERRVSIPDILMSWGGGTPQETMLKTAGEVPPQKTQTDPVAAASDGDEDADEDVACILSSKDSEALFKILKLPPALYDLLSESRGDDEPVESLDSVSRRLPCREEVMRSLNKSHKLPDDEQTTGDETSLHEDTADIIPYQMPLSGCRFRRNMNESVWSVESLAPFVPTKEWLLQNGMFEPEVIVEMTEEAENCRHSTQNDRPTRRLSSSDSAPMSDSWLIFSTPAEKPSPPKKPEMASEISASEARGAEEGQNTSPSDKDPSASPARPQRQVTVCSPAAEAVDENGSSEPEANRSPNQESLILNERRENGAGSPEREVTPLLSSAAGERVSSTGHLTVRSGGDEVDDGVCGSEEVRKEQLCVPKVDQKTSEVSPSKRHLVDCGVQCSELRCACEESNGGVAPNRRHPFKFSDTKRASNGKDEGTCTNAHVQKNHKRHGQWKGRGSEKHGNQQEVYYGYYGKPGKSKGGNGRNPRY
ncbi:uncharacterized protein LOC130178739 [Seriola aureovittata]|uniref:uncharacterized protein LOC130178739 n=2 Tax=Seriola TaxID=8160 RepID=UPI0024BD7303|nr:uncharacterized protein LOC130178739 [Seriola aureovittata]